jgi:hypothetical protein|tara:strand:+ start:49 stop:486 length:438 start_codon:yes stop_codon:yes gene_type:complete
MKANKKSIEVREKDRQALELRKAGASYEVIAKQLGYADSSGAYKSIQRSMKSIIAEPTEELRTVEYERLNQMLLILWERVQQGELGAIDRALSIMDRISKMYGLDSPRKTEVNQTITQGVMIVDGTKDEYLSAIRNEIDGEVVTD